MGQIKIFGLKKSLHPVREKLSLVLHECYVAAFQYPEEKKSHRFIYVEEDGFYYFSGRTEKHTIIEVNMFEGRSVEAKKQFYKLLFERFERELDIQNIDLEITLMETPKHNWGIRGKSGDELNLNYKINV
jgi:phenylpyruvate tautomerase PptA (4-oxalocrotonate tautomerase family)